MDNNTYLNDEEIVILEKFLKAKRLTKSDFGRKRGLTGQSGIWAFEKRKLKREVVRKFLQELKREASEGFEEVDKI